VKARNGEFGAYAAQGVLDDVQVRNVMQMCYETEAKASFAQFTANFSRAQGEFSARMKSAYETSSSNAAAILGCSGNALSLCTSAPMRNVMRMCFETETAAAYEQFMVSFAESKCNFIARMDASYDASLRKAQVMLGVGIPAAAVAERSPPRAEDVACVPEVEGTSTFDAVLAIPGARGASPQMPAPPFDEAAPSSSAASGDSSSACQDIIVADLPPVAATQGSNVVEDDGAGNLGGNSKSSTGDDMSAGRAQMLVSSAEGDAESRAALRVKGLAAKSPRASIPSVPVIQRPSPPDKGVEQGAGIAPMKLDAIARDIVEHLSKKGGQTVEDIAKSIGRQKRAVVCRVLKLVEGKIAKTAASVPNGNGDSAQYYTLA
jgi:hypothetical protein